ncbi:MAG: prolyl oligopeptidase family serine peptidase [Microbacteriaceae bacterium]|nr:prolyl oligopeptidase family serine peptidase [Microbacteriaceae bacterium]
MTVTLDAQAVLWSAPSDERAGRPLLVVMHGRGSDERDLFALAPALPTEFAIASVRAPLSEGAGWSWWESGAQPGEMAASAVDDAADAVLAWLDDLELESPLVGTLGFSQGGAMSVHLMRRDPDRFAFAVNLAGFVIAGHQAGDAALAERRPPVFWGRGADDPLFLGPMARLVAQTEPWLADHASADVRVYPGLGHSVSPEELDDVVAFLRAQPT